MTIFEEVKEFVDVGAAARHTTLCSTGTKHALLRKLPMMK